MIRKLRRRLVVVSIGSLLIVLLLIMGTVNILNYQQILRDEFTDQHSDHYPNVFYVPRLEEVPRW